MRHLLKNPFVGAIATLVAVAWEAFWLIGPPVGVDASARQSYQLWGLLCLTIAAVQAFYLLLQENRKLKADREPKFDIVFAPENDHDSRPFLQTMTVHLEYGLGRSGPKLVRMEDRRYRIGIVNLSVVAIPNIRVVLESCRPSGNFIHVGHRLLVTDSQPESGEADLPANVDGKPTRFFDVANELDFPNQTPLTFQFCYANPGIRGSVDANTYEIVLRAEGGNVSCARAFRVTKIDGKGGFPRTKLRMEPL